VRPPVRGVAGSGPQHRCLSLLAGVSARQRVASASKGPPDGPGPANTRRSFRSSAAGREAGRRGVTRGLRRVGRDGCRPVRAAKQRSAARCPNQAHVVTGCDSPADANRWALGITLPT
jgi:hypothetical protein